MVSAAVVALAFRRMGYLPSRSRNVPTSIISPTAAVRVSHPLSACTFCQPNSPPTLTPQPHPVRRLVVTLQRHPVAQAGTQAAHSRLWHKAVRVAVSVRTLSSHMAPLWSTLSLAPSPQRSAHHRCALLELLSCPRLCQCSLRPDAPSTRAHCWGVCVGIVGNGRSCRNDLGATSKLLKPKLKWEKQT